MGGGQNIFSIVAGGSWSKPLLNISPAYPINFVKILSMSAILLIAGFLILILNLFDFFFTTLSGNGSGWMTNGLNNGLSRLITRLGRLKNWSGLLHLILIFGNWFFWLMLSSFLLLLSQSDFVVNSTTKVPADIVERIYYTGFVLSTLGIGDFVPGTPFARLLTIALSTIGFVMLTTALTYLISVTNAVTKKKNLATFISRMGSTPQELYQYATAGQGMQLFLSSDDDLLQLMNAHANDHLSFPIVHHFLTKNRQRSAAVQVSSLHETLSILLKQASDGATTARLKRLMRALDYYLKVTQISQADVGHQEDIGKLRKACVESCHIPYESGDWKEAHTKAFTDYLYSSGWSWRDVYQPD